MENIALFLFNPPTQNTSFRYIYHCHMIYIFQDNDIVWNSQLKLLNYLRNTHTIHGEI